MTDEPHLCLMHCFVSLLFLPKLEFPTKYVLQIHSGSVELSGFIKKKKTLFPLQSLTQIGQSQSTCNCVFVRGRDF